MKLQRFYTFFSTLQQTYPVWYRFVRAFGHLMIGAGLCIIIYAVSIYADIAYHRLAARGDINLPTSEAALPFIVYQEATWFLGNVAAHTSDATHSNALPTTPMPMQNVAYHPDSTQHDGAQRQDIQQDRQPFFSTIRRIVIPSIDVDSMVAEIGWFVEQQDGMPVSAWEVADYMVGHHRGSANPGEGDNIVLSGHVGGYGMVFRDLFYVVPGNHIMLYSNEQQYLYTVYERLVLEDETLPPEQRIANARLIAPTGYEVLTLVTCWPPDGEDKYAQRIVLRAFPYRDCGQIEACKPTYNIPWEPSGWMAR